MDVGKYVRFKNNTDSEHTSSLQNHDHNESQNKKRKTNPINEADKMDLVERSSTEKCIINKPELSVKENLETNKIKDCSGAIIPNTHITSNANNQEDQCATSENVDIASSILLNHTETDCCEEAKYLQPGLEPGAVGIL